MPAADAVLATQHRSPASTPTVRRAARGTRRAPRRRRRAPAERRSRARTAPPAPDRSAPSGSAASQSRKRSSTESASRTRWTSGTYGRPDRARHPDLAGAAGGVEAGWSRRAGRAPPPPRAGCRRGQLGNEEALVAGEAAALGAGRHEHALRSARRHAQQVGQPALLDERAGRMEDRLAARLRRLRTAGKHVPRPERGEVEDAALARAWRAPAQEASVTTGSSPPRLAACSADSVLAARAGGGRAAAPCSQTASRSTARDTPSG